MTYLVTSINNEMKIEKEYLKESSNGNIALMKKKLGDGKIGISAIPSRFRRRFFLNHIIFIDSESKKPFQVVQHSNIWKMLQTCCKPVADSLAIITITQKK